MFTLTKNGLVRAVETAAEAERLTEQGYEAIRTAPDLPEGAEEFGGCTVPQLAELCNKKGIEIPRGTKKKEDFIALIMQQSEGEPHDEG